MNLKRIQGRQYTNVGYYGLARANDAAYKQITAKMSG